METRSVLRDIGLSGNEAKVYLALMDLGSALAGEITKKSGVNRTNVYDALDRLIEKGLVSYIIKSNRKYFEAEKPERIMNYLEEKQKEITSKKKRVSSIIPELELKRKLGKEPHEATIYKGKQGLKSITEDVLKTGKEMMAFGLQGNFVAIFTHYAKQWHMRRVKLKIPVRAIYNEKVRPIKTKQKFIKVTMRFNKSLYDTPASTWIYGDKVAIVVWSEPIIATLIRSKEVSKSYKQFFEFLWKNSKE